MKRNNPHVESQQMAGPKLHRTLCALCALVCALSVIMPAGAERNDRTKPVNLEADRVTVEESKQTAVFEGNLANFRQKREGYDEYVEGYAERIEYDSKAEKLQMFNRAHLKKGNDDVRGNYISYDSATEFFRVTGGGKQAASPGNPEGRVRAIIQPQTRDKPAAEAPAVPLKPAADMINPRENTPGSAR